MRARAPGQCQPCPSVPFLPAFSRSALGLACKSVVSLPRPGAGPAVPAGPVGWRGHAVAGVVYALEARRDGAWPLAWAVRFLGKLL